MRKWISALPALAVALVLVLTGCTVGTWQPSDASQGQTVTPDSLAAANLNQHGG